QEALVLLHENEKEIYGDVPDRVLDVIEAVGSPALRMAWDNANFVQVGVRPFTDGYAKLRPYSEYLQVKEARAADGTVVPAGALGGFSGPYEFGRAARAFAKLTDAIGVQLS